MECALTAVQKARENRRTDRQTDRETNVAYGHRDKKKNKKNKPTGIQTRWNTNTLFDMKKIWCFTFSFVL